MFERDSSTISEKGKILLKKIGIILKKHLEKRKNNYTIIVEGHTDTKGYQQHNLNLSFNRAKSVVNYWQQELDFGIYNDKELDLIPAGYGESRLLEETPDDSLNENNRRIEIRIIPKFDKILEEIISKNGYY